MSRKLKRVAMDFDWPLKKTWGGFLNPYYRLSTSCTYCVNGYDRAGGRADANAALFMDQWYANAPFDPIAYGAVPLSPDAPPIWDLAQRNVATAPDYYMTPEERAVITKFKIEAMTGFAHDAPLVSVPSFHKASAVAREAQRLYKLWRYQWGHHLIQADVDALVEAERLWDFTKTWSQEHGWQKRADAHHPTAAEVNEWSFSGLGHDSMNASVCVEARCARAGVPYTCSRCSGSGKIWPTAEIHQQYENWTQTDPPTGEGYQLWEDVSEGSPVSPVFATLDELCAWAEDNATTFGRFTATKAEWLEMLDGGIVHAKMGNNILL